jgi:hypothetical protein
MSRDPSPAAVAGRLAELSRIATLETVAQGRARLRAEALASDAFATGVAQRLEELRALDDLTRYLHSRATLRRSR